MGRHLMDYPILFSEEVGKSIIRGFPFRPIDLKNSSVIYFRICVYALSGDTITCMRKKYVFSSKTGFFLI
jgi:hypothetical protein